MRREHATPKRTLVVLLAVALLGTGAAFAAAGGEAVVDYTVVLEAPSTGQRLTAARPKSPRRAPRRVAASSIEHLGRAVTQTQEPVLTALEARGAQVLGSVRNVLNAIFVRATPQQAAEFAEIEGVKRVASSRTLELELDAIPEVVRLDAGRLRPDGGTFTGRGVRIAIIDSGLDFDHEAFRDDSLPALPGYPRGRPEHLRFANSKIVALRSYVRLQNSGQPETSTPDDESPRDFSGHGTAVAMLAGGRRVDSPVGMIEGIAPEAYLGVYKVSGTPGINPHPTSNAVIAAIDDAIVDGMDILNLSLGAPAQFPWYSYGSDCGYDESQNCDPMAVAAQSAVVDFGRVVVAAAGNFGEIGLQEFPAKNSISSPALAPDVIAVGAATNSRQLVQQVRVGARTYTALSGSGPGPEESLSAPMVAAHELGNALACSPFPAGSLVGSVVLIERGECWFQDKIEHADAAGALAVIVYEQGGSDELIEMGGVDGTDIPAYFVGARDGAALAVIAAEGSAGDQPDITLEAAPMAQPLQETRISSTSSRGPTPGLNLKPDLVAPGRFVYSASPRSLSSSDSFRPSGFKQSSGTSLAAPIVAGAAALVWQAYPDLTAREVTSALCNTARQTILEGGERARVGSVGGGLLDSEQALEPIATVEPPTIGFGFFGAQDLPVWQEILVTNRGLGEQSYRVIVEPRDADPHAAVTIDGVQEARFRLQPDEYVRLRISLEGLMPDPGSYEGRLRVSRTGGGRDLLVPYLYVVGDNEPHNSFPITPSESNGPVGEETEKVLAAKFVDRYGAPIVDLPVEFRVQDGDGRVLAASPVTDAFGLAHARVAYSGSPGRQVVVASGGGLEIPFGFEADVKKPEILHLVHGASLEAQRPVAPGSLVTIFGSGLTTFDGDANTSPLPISLKSSSASFDFPELGLSVPGRLLFVSQDQIQLQVPWEFAGLNFAYLKVRVQSKFGDSFASETHLVDLADVSPGIFVFESPAIQHPDGSFVTSSNPARPGGELSILMTGNGPLTRAVASGEAIWEANPTVHEPVVSVGDAKAAVAYSGLLPGYVGVYIVNLVLPADLTSGNLELRVTVDGTASNVVILPVQ